MGLAVAVPPSLRLLIHSRPIQLLRKRLIRSKMKSAFFPVPIENVGTSQSAIIVVCSDTVPNNKSNDHKRTTDPSQALLRHRPYQLALSIGVLVVSISDMVIGHLLRTELLCDSRAPSL